MTIGLLLSKPPSYSETYFISKIKGLQNSGFEVVLYVQKTDPNFSLCQVKTSPQVYKKNVLALLLRMLLVLGKLGIMKPKRTLRFIKLERNAKRSYRQILKNLYNNSHLLQADLDWVHFGFATMALQSEHVAKAIGAKMAVSLRGFDIDVYPLKFQACYKLLWEQVDKVHSISQYLLSKARKLGLSQEVAYQIITPAVDITGLPEHRVVKGPVKIISVGRLHWIKGLTYVLEALSILKANKISFEFTIVGDGAENQDIKFAIHQLGLSHQVFMLGRKTHDETKQLMAESDIFIQYSLSEGFCNAALEAQGMGLLCVVSDGGALPENVIDDHTGWVVTKRSPKILAAKIEKIINLPLEEQMQVRQKASGRVQSNFNLKKQELEFKTFYE